MLRRQTRHEEKRSFFEFALTFFSSGVLSGFNSLEIEECVADTFIYLWEHPKKFDPKRGKLSSWLVTITKSRAIDRLRKISREKEIPTEDVLAYIEGDIIYEKSEKSEISEKLIICIEKLPDIEREIIIRKYFRDEKNPEIAKAMKIGSKKLENHLYSAKQKLRKWLSE